MVKILLLHRGIINDYGIVQVTAFDKTQLDEGLYFANKDERAAAGNLLLELADVGQRGKLVAQHGRIILDHAVDGEIVIRQDDER